MRLVLVAILLLASLPAVAQNRAPWVPLPYRNVEPYRPDRMEEWRERRRMEWRLRHEWCERHPWDCRR